MPLNEHRSKEETELLARSIHEELERRHPGSFDHKRPLWAQAKLAGVTDTMVRSQKGGQMIETLFDDLSLDRLHQQRGIDHMVETSVTQLPHEDDGVVKTFIDRYTTMIVRDQALLE